MLRTFSTFGAIATLALVSCGGSSRSLTIHVKPEHEAIAAAFIANIPMEGLSVEVSDDPEKNAKGGGVNVAWVDDLSCVECYELDGRPGRVAVRAGDVLGLQYGTADLLEQMGLRFFHPHQTLVPKRFSKIDKRAFGVRVSPDSQRRGLHLHTLHPTEGMFDFWMPSGRNREHASRTLDWLIKNRGNHLQWVALDDITNNPGLHASWSAHTASIIEEAHLRGVTTGIAIQLFGASNLQQAFDLIDQPNSPDAPVEMARRLDLILGDSLEFDLVNLSFGEFFGAEPDAFVTAAEDAYDAIQAARPGIEVAATIHVGNFDDLRISYADETDLLYYFLVKFADRPYVPWIHTVMYYNLFEDAGLAYLHESFDEHRDFLLAALRDGEPVAYFPESAYWVAFDINVPTWTPLYMRSRWTDYDRIAQAGNPLQEHVLFSSGWEWGYWQNDVFTLREGYQRTDTWGDTVRWMFEPWGDNGEALANIAIGVGDLQHEYLLVKRLAPYFASRDGAMDVGDRLGIVSQPPRPLFSEARAFNEAERTAFGAEVLTQLARFADANNTLAGQAFALNVPDSDPWVSEMRDGARINTLRARFIAQVYLAALTQDASSARTQLRVAEDLLKDARAVITRRHARLHDPDGDVLTQKAQNPTIYNFGYLEKTDTLCYWEREIIEVQNLIEPTSVPVPGCVL